MSKKTTNKNTYITNNEIDYEKLANAIVLALSKNDERQGSETTIAKGFSTICSVVFSLLASFTTIFTIAFAALPIVGLLNPLKYQYDLTIQNAIALIMIVSILSVLSVFLWKASSAILKEKDKNFILALFSSMVSLAAMIIAAVSLFNTVK